MTRRLTIDQTRMIRLRAQFLQPEASKSITGVNQLVQALLGLQAQELPSATLAIRPRSASLTAEDVKKAREDDRSIVLTWCMRGTMHLLPAEDVGWLLSIFGPLFIRKGKRRFSQLGLTPEIRSRAATLMVEAIRDRGPMSRPELAEELAAHGIPVEGQAIAHLVRAAALEGLICFGLERKRTLTYVLLDGWIASAHPAHFTTEEILAKLAQRYLSAYGPASIQDFVSWAGISVSQARKALNSIDNMLVECEFDGLPVWLLKEQSSWLDEGLHGIEQVRLLPRYDTYLLGYKSRDFLVDRANARWIHPGGGIIKQTVIEGGKAIAIWRIDGRGKAKSVVVEPFRPLSSKTWHKIENEVRDMARFLQEEIQLRHN